MDLENIKVMTYNIHSTIGTDGVANWRRVADIIQKEKPDILGLEEIASYHQMTPDLDVAAEMSTYLGMNYFFGMTMPINEGKGEYGIAAMTPHKMELIKKLYLPIPGEYEPRIAIFVKFSSSIPFYFVVTHFPFQGEFDGDEDCRTECAKHITDTIIKNNLFPIIWVGDFNTYPSTKTLQYIHKDWDVCNDIIPDKPTAKTSLKGWQQIDFICCYPKGVFKIKEFNFINDLTASDHKPVTATLKLET
ncbi:MAG: hypothetical protein A2017_19105 [Lentisphaerae bacterium GWF2_44_16]|nr:MAG: hypothetical protein A2017_19105 [Lentisphaerae bacterium GWF2_44_16]